MYKIGTTGKRIDSHFYYDLKELSKPTVFSVYAKSQWASCVTITFPKSYY